MHTGSKLPVPSIDLWSRSFAGIFAILIPALALAQDVNPFAEHVRSTDPLTPEAEREAFQLPPGFEIQLVVAEPDISKPMNLAFDERGRLWVTCSTEYPFPLQPGKTGRDAIKILEDTDGDGRADRVTTFADGLNIPIGIYPYRGGAIAFSIPNLYHLIDHDGDGRADERKILYGPVGWERDTHGLNNSFRRAFDGWLYVCHGFNNQSTINGADGSSISLQSGNTYRVRLDGSRIEQYTWGQVNPFGMTFDTYGNLFTADCHSVPLTQLLRGGYYPSFGKPHDGLGFVPSMMTHHHGSTAICGVAYYADQNFPPQYRGSLFVGNVWTSRVNRDSLLYDGSTVTAHEEEDFIRTKDAWFRPVDLRIGPDGALYIADFYNRIIGHYEVPLTHPGRDRHRGRIWRVIYTGADPMTKPARLPPSLEGRSIEKLVEALEHPSLTYRTLAMNRLVDVFGKDAGPAVARAFGTSRSAHARAHALWILHRVGELQVGTLETAVRDDDPEVRVHALRILSETPDWSSRHSSLAVALTGDSNPFAQAAAAEALGLHPSTDYLVPLLELGRRKSDPRLRHTARIALRNHLRVPAIADQIIELGWKTRMPDLEELCSIALAVNTPSAGSFVLRYVTRHARDGDVTARHVSHAARNIPPEDVDALVVFVKRKFAADLDFQLELLEAIGSGLSRSGAESGPVFRQWGGRLADALLTSSLAEPPSWVNRPVPRRRPSVSPWAIQQRKSRDGNNDERFFCSLPRSETLTGILRSPTFTVPERLSFFIAGHDGSPGQARGNKNFVRLVAKDDGSVLALAPAPRNDTARRVRWRLGEHAGKDGYLEIVDGDTAGAFAWIAAGRFDPDVAPLPTIAPSRIAERRQAGARLARQYRLEALKPQLTALLLRDTLELETRTAIATALTSFQDDATLAVLASVSGDPALAEELRERISRTIAALDTKQAESALADAIRQSARGLQIKLAQALAGTPRGAGTLLTLVSQGQASPRLLLRPSVREKLLVARPADKERIEELTADLPPESEESQKAIAAQIKAYRRSSADAAKGAVVFEKTCSPCHQIGGKGGLIGPQLEGIGSRGLERIVEDLLDPNRNLDVAFRATTFVLDDGQVLFGLYRRDEGKTLIMADNTGKEISIATDRIVQRIKTQTSLMPENFVETVQPGELYDLLAFLLSQRKKSVEEE